MRRIFTYVGLFLLVVAFAEGGFYTGNMLLNDLTAELDRDSVIRVSMANGYVIGVFDAYDGFLFSSPDKVTHGQIKDIAIKYLKNHPEKRHRLASLLLLEAFLEVFPKKDNNGDRRNRGLLNEFLNDSNKANPKK